MERAGTVWSHSLVDFIKQLHNVDLVWKPKHPDDEPPF